MHSEQLKYNTKNCAVSKVQALKSSQPSVLSDFQSFLCYAHFQLSNQDETPTNRFCSLGMVWECP